MTLEGKVPGRPASKEGGRPGFSEATTDGVSRETARRQQEEEDEVVIVTPREMQLGASDAVLGKSLMLGEKAEKLVENIDFFTLVDNRESLLKAIDSIYEFDKQAFADTKESLISKIEFVIDDVVNNTLKDTKEYLVMSDEDRDNAGMKLLQLKGITSKNGLREVVWRVAKQEIENGIATASTAPGKRGEDYVQGVSKDEIAAALKKVQKGLERGQ